ncbi:amidohydrolase family protein [Limibacter armeniacum]|uniref:metal-dependent hydrolase family protein n=1 Tax=Limibacter armeniacum TaxID=466084 RepID=UPI002FE65096
MKKLGLLFTVLLGSSCLFAQKTIIHCGKLIDGSSDKAMKEMSILLDSNKILDVKKGYVMPEADEQLIDLSGQTVMPGLMDMHVHLEGEFSPSHYMDRFVLDDIDVAFRSTVYAKKTLMTGFTTVRDLGGSGVNIALRKAIDGGWVEGPRVYTAGKSIATTGGHADPTNGMRRTLRGNPGPKEGVINGADEAKEAIRHRYKNGADVIKITATGGVLSVAKDGKGAQFTDEELKAIVETAADYNFVTAAHAHGAEGMKRAVNAGIHSIEHGTEMTEEIMELMIEKGTYYVPTITAGKAVTENAKKAGFYPGVIVPKALEIGPKIQGTFSRAYKKGVKIAFGTDAGVFPHGENWKEFIYMTEVGMSPMEAIQSATKTASELLGISKEVGTIQKGKLADIVAVDGDPLENIEVMEKVVFVMKDGKVYKSEYAKPQ